MLAAEVTPVFQRKATEKLQAFKSHLYLRWSCGSTCFEPTASGHTVSPPSRVAPEGGIMWKRGKQKSDPTPSPRPPVPHRKLAERSGSGQRFLRGPLQFGGATPFPGGVFPLQKPWFRKFSDPHRCTVFFNVFTVSALPAPWLLSYQQSHITGEVASYMISRLKTIAFPSCSISACS